MGMTMFVAVFDGDTWKWIDLFDFEDIRLHELTVSWLAVASFETPFQAPAGGVSSGSSGGGMGGGENGIFAFFSSTGSGS
ncbi:MAG: hypothetical protein ACREMY_20020, partial [bacterium]